jgi:hypothetical protein
MAADHTRRSAISETGSWMVMPDALTQQLISANLMQSVAISLRFDRRMMQGMSARRGLGVPDDCPAFHPPI